jgi:F-type H+-transporting ATPase subunit delta
MAGLTVEITYGNAIYMAAKEENILDDIRDELKEIEKAFLENPQLNELLKNPAVSTTDKKIILNKIFKNNINEISFNFLNVLIDKRRIGSFGGILKEFNKLVAEKEGVMEGIVYSVIPIDEKRIGQLELEAEKLLNKQVKLKNELDDTLIGGVSIEIEGKLIDASLKSRLKGLTKELLKK